MATGIIESIVVTTEGKSGKVKSDETGELLGFTNQSFDCGVGDEVEFEIIVGGILPYADSMTCLPGGVVNHPDSPIKGDVDKDFIVLPNQKLTVKGGGNVTGNISIQGGKFKIAGGGNVTGNISIQKSGSIVINGGRLTGDIVSEEAELIKVNGGGNVTGNISIQKGLKMVLDGGMVNGTLTVDTAYKVVIKSNSSIGCQ